MDQKISEHIKNLFDETSLEQLNLSFLEAINEKNATNEKKRNIIHAFLRDYLENYLVMIVNNTDTDEHLAEIFEAAEKNLSFEVKRSLLKKYVSDFENKEKNLFDLYVKTYLENYAK